MAIVNVGELRTAIKDVPDEYTLSIASSENGVLVPTGRDRFGPVFDTGSYTIDERCSEVKDISVDHDLKEVNVTISVTLDEQ